MSIQNEVSSFKLLLKQVYNAHTTKVKELENEVKTLKEKLTEKEREAISNLSECKRCIELEEAFKSCKKALQDQSKLFDNFGQKFSIFNSPELGTQEYKNTPKISNCVSETARFSKCLKSNATSFCDKNESTIISLGENIVAETKVNNADKIPMVSNNQNLLKKVMCEDENLGTFEAYTVTFPENLKHEGMNVKPDLIFAPDSLDTSLETNNKCEAISKEIHSKGHEIKKISNGNEYLKQTEKNRLETRASCKRLSDSVNEERAKRCNIDNQAESCSKVSKVKDMKSCNKVPKIVVSSEDSNQEVKTKTNLKDSNAQNVQMSKKKISPTVLESKDNKNEVPKNSVNNVSSDSKNKFTSHEISPSLLPVNTNVPPKIIDLETISNDNDDFQELGPISKSIQSEDSWDTCDKKKLSRKNKNVKSIKSTSRFKMTLDAPPLDYKKPNLKQTKLSKSLFKAKEGNINQKSPKQNEPDSDFEMIEDNTFPAVLQDHFQTSTQFSTTKSPFTVDIDATFIPENFKFEASPCATSSVKKNAVEKSNLKNGGLFSNISFPEEIKPSSKDEDSRRNENEINDHSSSEDAEVKENMNSFDRLPLPEEPKYKYKNEVVRKKAERRQLNAFDCNECEKYYSELGLTDKEKKERMKKCSRHRGKFTPPKTPDHFWELDFPDTQECKARGYMNETQKVKLTNIYNL